MEVSPEEEEAFLGSNIALGRGSPVGWRVLLRRKEASAEEGIPREKLSPEVEGIPRGRDIL